MTGACVAYVFFVITVFIVGFLTKSIYEGYLFSKGRELNIVEKLDLEILILKIAGWPVYLVFFAIAIISFIPFGIGRLIGKLLK